MISEIIDQKTQEIEVLDNLLLHTIDELINLETKDIADKRVYKTIHEIMSVGKKITAIKLLMISCAEISFLYSAINPNSNQKNTIKIEKLCNIIKLFFPQLYASNQ